MHCIVCDKEIYGVLIHGHCRECAARKIEEFDLLSQDLKDAQEHVDELLTELRRLSIKNQSLKNRRRLQKSDPDKEKRSLMSEEEYREFLEKLGKYRDSDLAREYGVSDSYVCRTRQKLGIPTYANNEELWSKIDPVIFDKSIRAIAAEFGIDRGRVERRRKKLLQNTEKLVNIN
ncbi:hypothetical protein [Spirochaeta isovalerica]|uniref:Regulator of replication initiation timing n=1 Tax=Spirochaeta isovalerica TaxID=150 RepID=A0A841RBC8_9SPIO|nr:hypothetical protein [Spirochaeta isovalerica]MBB6480661.1 regulator of replication initiation timing [Spirochaeta isovalerica]